MSKLKLVFGKKNKKIIKKKVVLPERKEKMDREKTKVIGNFFALLFLITSILTMLIVVNLQVTNSYRGNDLNAYAKDMYEKVESITSQRGIITDVKGNKLAVNINTFDMYATICDPNKEPEKIPACVSDGAPVAPVLLETLGLNGDAEAITLFNEQLTLQVDVESQVEFGTYGKKLTIEQKEEIEALNLPGIKFNTNSSRYYPYGNFASYVLGYVRTDENGNQVGELGIEKSLDSYLRGVTGSEIISKDGNEVPLMSDQQQKLTKKTDGSDIELTIDSQIQTYVQEEMNKQYAEKKFDQAFTLVMDTKTGAILGMYALDSFNPNLRDVKNYNDPIADFCYEPGSTFKSFVVGTAMELGVYDPNNISPTGKRYKEEWGDGKYVADWLYNSNGMNWGDQPWYKSLYFSLNTAMTYIQDAIGNDRWMEYVREKYLFGKSITSGFLNTAACEVAPVYPLDYSNTSFGQGMTVNALQMMRAYSIFGNKGQMLEPHFVNKMFDPETGEAFYDASTDKSLAPKKVLSEETVSNVLKDLEQVVYYTEEGKPNHYEGTNAILKDGKVRVGGKTGTAEIATNGIYGGDVIASNVALAPIDDPQILIYSVVVRPTPNWDKDYIGLSMSSIIDKTIAYLSQKELNTEIDLSGKNRYTAKNYAGVDIEEASNELNSNAIATYKIGTGNVITQYPPAGVVMSANETITLKADGEFDANAFMSMTYNQAFGICKVMNWDCKINGMGSVTTVEKLSDTSYQLTLEPPAKVGQ